MRKIGSLISSRYCLFYLLLLFIEAILMFKR